MALGRRKPSPVWGPGGIAPEKNLKSVWFVEAVDSRFSSWRYTAGQTTRYSDIGCNTGQYSSGGGGRGGQPHILTGYAQVSPLAPHRNKGSNLSPPGFATVRRPTAIPGHCLLEATGNHGKQLEQRRLQQNAYKNNLQIWLPGTHITLHNSQFTISPR